MKKRGFDFIRLAKTSVLLASVVLAVVFRGPLLRAATGLAYTAAAMQLPSVSLPEEEPPQSTAASVPEALIEEVVSAIMQNTSSVDSQPETADRQIKELQLVAGENDLSVKGVTLSNKTDLAVDVAASLSKEPVFDLVRNGRPQVLIIHTHGSEAYLSEEQQSYSADQRWNSDDPDAGVRAVGAVIAEKLNEAGINTIHDTELYDTQFANSYENAGEAIESWLKKYSSIEMVIDIHRDSVTYDDGTKIKPTVTVDGQKAAQVMMIVGCDGDGALPFSGWKNNLSLAFRLQRQLNADYEGLARPIYFIDRRYNMHYTKNSLLLEVGTEVNTLEEALYSAELVADALLEVLSAL